MSLLFNLLCVTLFSLQVQPTPILWKVCFVPVMKNTSIICVMASCVMRFEVKNWIRESVCSPKLFVCGRHETVVTFVSSASLPHTTWPAPGYRWQINIITSYLFNLVSVFSGSFLGLLLLNLIDFWYIMFSPHMFTCGWFFCSPCHSFLLFMIFCLFRPIY